MKDIHKKIDQVYESCQSDDQRLNAMKFAELAGKTLNQSTYMDPYKQIEYSDRRTHGCFACHHSKYEEIDGKFRSLCRPLSDGIIHKNKKGEPLEYPDESQGTCGWFVRKRK